MFHLPFAFHWSRSRDSTDLWTYFLFGLYHRMVKKCQHLSSRQTDIWFHSSESMCRRTRVAYWACQGGGAQALCRDACYWRPNCLWGNYDIIKALLKIVQSGIVYYVLLLWLTTCLPHCLSNQLLFYVWVMGLNPVWNIYLYGTIVGPGLGALYVCKHTHNTQVILSMGQHLPV